MAQCAQCDGTGYKPVTVGSVTRYTRCDHGAAARKPQAVGEVLSAAVEMLLTDDDRKIREILRERQGAAAAMTSGDIGSKVWPQHVLAGGDAEERRRWVTNSIEKLRRLAKMPIAASKIRPYGYYLAVTAAEFDEMYERHKNELIAHAQIMKLFRPEADVVQELRGQLAFAGETPGR